MGFIDGEIQKNKSKILVKHDFKDQYLNLLFELRVYIIEIDRYLKDLEFIYGTSTDYIKNGKNQELFMQGVLNNLNKTLCTLYNNIYIDWIIKNNDAIHSKMLENYNFAVSNLTLRSIKNDEFLFKIENLRNLLLKVGNIYESEYIETAISATDCTIDAINNEMMAKQSNNF